MTFWSESKFCDGNFPVEKQYSAKLTKYGTTVHSSPRAFQCGMGSRPPQSVRVDHIDSGSVVEEHYALDRVRIELLRCIREGSAAFSVHGAASTKRGM